MELLEINELKGKDRKKAEKIIKIINQYRTVEERINALKKENFCIKSCCLGSGGSKSIRFYPRLNETRVQISYGMSSYNFAYYINI